MTVLISSLASWKNTLIPKQSASKIPVLDPARRVDAKCCSVCSSAKSYFQPFSIFLLSFSYHRQNDTILQTIFGCLSHLLVHPMRKDVFPPPNSRLFFSIPDFEKVLLHPYYCDPVV